MWVGALIGVAVALFVSEGVNKPHAPGALIALIADVLTGAILGVAVGALVQRAL